jgi:hypothetical protein
MKITNWTKTIILSQFHRPKNGRKPSETLTFYSQTPSQLFKKKILQKFTRKNGKKWQKMAKNGKKWQKNIQKMDEIVKNKRFFWTSEKINELINLLRK